MYARCSSNPRRQQGAVLAIVAVLLVVLIGIAALGIDLGRVLVFRSEMQNAVDDAALAGAAELDGKPGARARAMSAARNLLVHSGHHATVSELLGDAMPSDEDTFEFFCYIGSQYDIEGACTGTAIDDDGDGDDDKILATGDEDAHYVRVKLLPDAENRDAYVVPLYFLPVLSFFSGDLKNFQEVAAGALAGRHYFMCNYPPVMICDPFENGAAIPGVNNFKEAVDQGYLETGDTVLLKYQGPDAAWTPGNFAFLTPGVSGDYETGARAIGEYLANPCSQPCTPPVVRTKPGSVESWPVWGINTVFETYEHGAFNPDDYPPAPNIVEYPSPPNSTETAKSWDSSGRFFEGDWSWLAYRNEFHNWRAGGVDPGFEDLSGMTRWEVYNLEIATGFLPYNPDGADNVSGTADDLTPPSPPNQLACVFNSDENCPAPPSGYTMTRDYDNPWSCRSSGYNPPGSWPRCRDIEPDGDAYPVNTFPEGRAASNNLHFDSPPQKCEAIRAGEDPSTPNSIPERRTMYVAIIQCVAQDVHGASSPVADAFAQFFLTQRARIDKVDNRKLDVITEFMGLVDDKDAEYHVEVQLYE